MTFSVFVTKAVTFLMTLFITLVPYNGIAEPVLKTAEENCELNMALISDTHLETKEILRQLRFRFSSNIHQLARIAGLSYDEAARLMDSE